MTQDNSNTSNIETSYHKDFVLKNGQTYSVRYVKLSDVENLVDYLNIVAGETENLTFGPGELNITLEQETLFVKNAIDNSHQYFVVADYDGKLIGNLSFIAGRKPRVAHIGEFGVSVIKEFWGNGIAFKLISSLIEWAKEDGVIKKIDLRVRIDNTKAITLYKNLGFEIEGTIRRSYQINGEFIDAYHMGKIIE